MTAARWARPPLDLDHTSRLDDAITRGPECRWCKTAIHDGDTCIECWRDRRTLAIERDREWWAS